MLNFDELEKGFTEEEALEEARRCLKCKTPLCVKGGPIENRIPEIIAAIERKDYRIRISKLERFLAEKEMELALNRLRGKVAVIGSGPAGLSVTSIMAKQSYRVTVFEAQHKVGGVLRLKAESVLAVDIVPEKERRASDKEYAEALDEGWPSASRPASLASTATRW
ncbi:MAG: NAD(P)-binding protein [Desulfuromonadales bacterium]